MQDSETTFSTESCDSTQVDNSFGCRPVDIGPSALSLGDGKYQCEYTPVRASSAYVITIKVGRGGSAYRDVIGGVDFDPTDSEHDYIGYYNTLGVKNPNPYSLKVAPGPTDPLRSVATGSFLSVSTAGVVGSFTITAQDQFTNRRPGGDNINVLLTQWNMEAQMPLQPDQVPKSGTVSDNSDGSYGVSYTVTVGGMYHLAISFSGVVGADTPTYLQVRTAVADVSSTIVFGALQDVTAGSSHEVFVQTRDKYGNNLLVDPEDDPSGGEQVGLEVCLSQGSDDSKACRGGQLELNVGITVEYSVGPNGASTNGAVPFYGMYRIIFFPFVPGDYTLLVRHNGVLVCPISAPLSLLPLSCPSLLPFLRLPSHDIACRRSNVTSMCRSTPRSGRRACRTRS